MNEVEIGLVVQGEVAAVVRGRVYGDVWRGREPDHAGIAWEPNRSTGAPMLNGASRIPCLLFSQSIETMGYVARSLLHQHPQRTSYLPSSPGRNQLNTTRRAWHFYL